MRNLGYYLREVKTIFFMNGFSSVLSMISLIMIFFIVMLAAGSWRISTDLVEALRNEAEINVYYDTGIGFESLKTSIQKIDGVQNVRHVDAQTAYKKMSEILGQDAAVLSNFEENPFEPYLEIGIDLDLLIPVVSGIEALPGVIYVRDNQTILEKVASLARVISGLGLFVAAAVGTATFIVTSHIIREGIHSNREQIMTLKLLGAPNRFIYFPFVLEGILVTTVSGVIAVALFVGFVQFFAQQMAGVFTFVPAVDHGGILRMISLGMILASVGLGLAASLFGLKMVKNHGMRV